MSTQANWYGTTDDFQTCRADKGTRISGAEITKWTEEFAELCFPRKILYHQQKHPPALFHHLLKFVITENNVKNSYFRKQVEIMLSSSSFSENWFSNKKVNTVFSKPMSPFIQMTQFATGLQGWSTAIKLPWVFPEYLGFIGSVKNWTASSRKQDSFILSLSDNLGCKEHSGLRNNPFFCAMQTCHGKCSLTAFTLTPQTDKWIWLFSAFFWNCGCIWYLLQNQGHSQPPSSPLAHHWAPKRTWQWSWGKTELMHTRTTCLVSPNIPA